MSKEIIPKRLLHITSTKKCNQIENDKEIKPSIHNVEDGKIQYLGDGIYFWDCSDDQAIKVGKNLVCGKYKCNECCGLIADVEIEKERHMDLENNKWYQLYIKFIKAVCPDYYEKINDYMKMISDYEKTDTEILNKIGILTGNSINLFEKYLKEQKNIIIDMVSGYFPYKRDEGIIFKRNIIKIRQFCIKDEKIINNKFDSIIIKHNI